MLPPRPRAKDKDEDSRRRRTSESTRSRRERDSDGRSVISSTSTRKTPRRDTAPSSVASFATAFEDIPRSRVDDDIYNDSRDERYTRRRDDRAPSYAGSSISTSRRDRSRSRDRDDKDRRRTRDKDKDRKSDKRRSTRSERSEDQSQVSGYRGDYDGSSRIGERSFTRGDFDESSRAGERSFSSKITNAGFSQFPGQVGADVGVPMMSGALPLPPPLQMTNPTLAVFRATYKTNSLDRIQRSIHSIQEIIHLVPRPISTTTWASLSINSPVSGRNHPLTLLAKTRLAL